MSFIIFCLLSFFVFPAFGQTTQRWTQTIPGSFPNTQVYSTVDLIGNIYVVATVQTIKGDADWVIASYSPDSVIRWINYKGTFPENDIAKGVFVDSTFNVYVTGDINSSGITDIGILKLDSAGTIIFDTLFSRTSSSDDKALNISVLNENIYVSGNSQATNGYYDYTILKYNSVGTLQWSQFYNGSGNKNDFSTGMSVKWNGDVFVTGYSKNVSENFDYATAKISSGGSLLWSRVYAGTEELDDFANAIDIDNAGFIYVTGQSFETATNSDYITIKYDNNGNQKWLARYDGPGKGIDKAVAITAKSPGQIFITGSSEKSVGNFDYATIRYAANGQMKWLQRYDGGVNSIDEAKTIILDGTDVVVTGNSNNVTGFFDIVMLSYIGGNGNINWTIRSDGGNSSSSDFPYALSIDQMGNVYVAGIINTSGTGAVSLSKINQLHKNELQIESVLQFLAHGFVPIRNNSAALQIIHNKIELVVDSFTQIRVQDFLQACASNGLNILPEMNSSISSFYSIDTSYNWMKILLGRVYYRENKGFPMVYVESFFSFSESAFTSSHPEIAYTYFESDYPFPSITATSGFLTRDAATTSTSLNVIFFPGHWLTRTPQILLCTAYGSVNEPCHVCTLPALGGLPWITGSATQSHEISIKTGYYSSQPTNWSTPLGGPDDCLNVIDVNSSDDAYYSAGQNYAVLRAIPGYFHYKRYYIGDDYEKIKKIQYPILTVHTGAQGYSMSLCAEECQFNDINPNSAYTVDYALGMGGVYEITRPGTNMQPVYFAFPYTKNLWFIDGPDMGIGFGATYTNNYCSNNYPEITQDYFVGPCQMCGPGQSVFGMTSTQEHNILATTDYSAISSYWSDNAVTVGFSTSASAMCAGNAYTFYADNNSSNDCNPSGYPNLGALLCQMDVLPDYAYEFRNAFIGNATYAAGTQLLIYVVAKFGNNEQINDCMTVTLGSNSIPYSNIAVEIRGAINDYSSSSVSYRVQIYQLN